METIELKRITPDEVVMAYLFTGLEPMTGAYLNTNKNCACAIGAIAKLKDSKAKNSNDCIEWIEENFSMYYHTGFTNGFDDTDPVTLKARITAINIKHNKETFMIGYEDGQNARKAVIEAGLTNREF